jgi:hypothetical protein
MTYQDANQRELDVTAMTKACDTPLLNPDQIAADSCATQKASLQARVRAYQHERRIKEASRGRLPQTVFLSVELLKRVATFQRARGFSRKDDAIEELLRTGLDHPTTKGEPVSG